MYNNRKLSDYGCILCNITNTVDTEIISIGSEINFNTVYTPSNHKFKLMSTTYTEPYKAVYQICKYDCRNPDDTCFTTEEIASITRWLNQKVYKKFKLISDDSQYDNIYFLGTFNVSKIVLGDETIGLELNFQADSPFGNYENMEFELNFTTGNEEFEVYDLSDEIGTIYPKDVIIECLADGDLEIHNSQDGLRSTVIKNCTAGETITMNGEYKIITSDKAHPKLYNDFNYNYLRISNKDEDNADDLLNLFTVSIPCNIKFSYSPICKVGLV